MFTPEQVEVLLNMGNATEGEKQQARMQQFANQLRTGGMGMGTNMRMDTASQIARGLQGVGGAMATNQVGKYGTTATDQRREMLRKLFPSKSQPIVGAGVNEFNSGAAPYSGMD